MLSIITCNYDPTRIEPLKNNIGSKIGLDIFELVVIDNRSNSKSIFQAYNEGADLASFNNILFIHDDIKFVTEDFGRILLEMHLPNLGVLGIAGSVLKTKTPSPWWVSNYHKLSSGILYQYNIQHSFHSKPEKVELGFKGEDEINEVLMVDGVLMYTSKNNWRKYPFDSTNFNSFHFYDLDFSLGMKRIGKMNYVTNKILIEHYSSGSLNKEWINSSKIFSAKWPKIMFVGSVDEEQINKIEMIAIESIIRILLDNNFIVESTKFILKGFYFNKNTIKILLRLIIGK